MRAPFKPDEPLILEKRYAPTAEQEARGWLGSLDFSEPRPPCIDTTLDNMTAHWFMEQPGAKFTWEAFDAWLKSKGWVLRRKTW